MLKEIRYALFDLESVRIFAPVSTNDIAIPSCCRLILRIDICNRHFHIVSLVSSKR